MSLFFSCFKPKKSRLSKSKLKSNNSKQSEADLHVDSKQSVAKNHYETIDSIKIIMDKSGKDDQTTISTTPSSSSSSTISYKSMSLSPIIEQTFENLDSEDYNYDANGNNISSNNDIDNNNKRGSSKSTFIIRPIRLNFNEDENNNDDNNNRDSNVNVDSNNYNIDLNNNIIGLSNNNDHSYYNNNGNNINNNRSSSSSIDAISQSSSTTSTKSKSSLCNLDNLFGKECIPFVGDKFIVITDRKDFNPLHLIVRRNSDGTLVDDIVRYGLNNDNEDDDRSMFDKIKNFTKLSLNKIVENEMDDDFHNSLKRIFHTPKKGDNKSSFIDDDKFHLGFLRKWYNEPMQNKHQDDDGCYCFEFDLYLNRLFAKRNDSNRIRNNIKSSILLKKQQTLKYTRIAKKKRRQRRKNEMIDFYKFNDSSLQRLFNTVDLISNHQKNNNENKSKRKLSLASLSSADSTCLDDSGISSNEIHHSSKNNNDNDGLNMDSRISFSLKKEFWQQFCDRYSKKADDYVNRKKKIIPPSSPSSMIKPFRSLPEPITNYNGDDRIYSSEKSQNNKSNSINTDDIDQYGILKKIKSAKLGECEQYLNKFELMMRKYYPELEHNEELDDLLTLLIGGLPKELYWLNFWIRSNFNCKCDNFVLSNHKIDFDQIKAIILNEEKTYLYRKALMKNDEKLLKSLTNEALLQLCHPSKNEHHQSFNVNDNINEDLVINPHVPVENSNSSSNNSNEIENNEIDLKFKSFNELRTLLRDKYRSDRRNRSLSNDRHMESLNYYQFNQNY